jgi:hypothetical protein
MDLHRDVSQPREKATQHSPVAVSPGSTDEIATPVEESADAARCAADEWQEAVALQAEGRRRNSEQGNVAGVVSEFRRKLANGEAFSRALVKLAEALRFTGRITVSFHQGGISKTTLEESFLPERGNG